MNWVPIIGGNDAGTARRNRVPDSNVGIIMGRVSNLIGIDVDGIEGIALLSIGVIGHARTGLLVAEDPDDEHKRILAV